jgi:hypothetical protein
MANEPVAWHYPDGKPDQCTTDKAYAEKEPAWTPMYYKHEWVGLTEDEIKEFDTWHDNREEEVGWCNPSEIVAYIEAKLKEKNT